MNSLAFSSTASDSLFLSCKAEFVFSAVYIIALLLGGSFYTDDYTWINEKPRVQPRGCTLLPELQQIIVTIKRMKCKKRSVTQSKLKVRTNRPKKTREGLKRSNANLSLHAKPYLEFLLIVVLNQLQASYIQVRKGDH